MRMNIGPASRPGLIKDLPGYVLPISALTNTINVRTNDEAIVSSLGYIKNFTPANIPYYLAGINDPADSVYYVVYCCDGYVGTYDGLLDHDLTPAGILSGKNWDHDIINNNLVFTNEVNAPYYWDTETANNLITLPGWNADTCNAIAAFKGHIFAIDVTDTGVRYPNRFKWSSQASFGIPQSWDQTDPASGAGETDLGESNTVLLNGRALRDTFFLYGENQTFGIQRIGGDAVWRFYTAFKSYGMLAKHCVVDFHNHHLVVVDGDVRVHNGQTHESVINKRNRRFLFGNMSTDNYQNTFVVRNVENDEIWICWPQQGSTYADMALIWNYEDNTWTTKDLPRSTTHIAATVEQTGNNLLWKDANFTWKNAVIRWGERLFNPTVDTLLSATDTVDPTSGVVEVYKHDIGIDHNGVSREARAERIGFRFDESEGVFQIRAVYPKMSGDDVEFQIGSQFVPDGDITWHGPFAFDPQTQYKFDCRVTGRYFSYRVFSNSKWRLSELTFDYESVGDR